ncbi:hypothetical protein S-MbCM7_204 [Synechococcus phage ACG-2014h]|uniref:Uncharacterized protein n=1 Tax=Synechococcus phage ACG-2014h TaxID=1340810 RepID=V5USH9_9CAUD|nr:hypothetical protein S-MbCM7_204 [Synechococcus phage ACG-2014h]AHB80618.1 hypothetical protein S-MbCM7_204 [Synechococcus phage ACG-2014h]
MKIKIVHENCDASLAKDTSLPYTAYIVEYPTEGGVQYDIAISSKQVDIFDYYWDKYGGVLNMKQTDGKINPKMWNDPSDPSKKKK